LVGRVDGSASGLCGVGLAFQEMRCWQKWWMS
jgi:hypothetical protein